MNFETIKTNAIEEIKGLIYSKIEESFKKNIFTENQKNNLLKIINFNIIPIVDDVLEKNKKNILNKIEVLNLNQELDETLRQYEINVYINSLLSIWKKTVLGIKIALATSESVKYIKLLKRKEDNKTPFKEKEKIKKSINTFVKKYNLIENIE